MVSLVDSDTFAFADGNAGHVCDLGSAPSVGHWDILCVNSDTVVSTPSGFTLVDSVVGNQGAYIFAREAVGGEASTVTVTTSGNFNCQVSWSRWSGIDAADTAGHTTASSSANSTPAHSTGTLTATDELVIAFGALHAIGSGNQNTPVWSAGYTGATVAIQGSGSSGVVGYVGYKTGAGTAAETPSVSWSGDAASDRYMLTVTFTTTAGGPAEVTLTPAALTLTAVPVTATPGPVTVALTPASVALAAVPVTATPGLVTVALTPAVLVLTAVRLGLPSTTGVTVWDGATELPASVTVWNGTQEVSATVEVTS